jgi:hypothetical protein
VVVASEAGNPQEQQQQQQRELEEIRRSFHEIGVKVGSMFEPAEPNGTGTDQPALPASATEPKPSSLLHRPIRMLALALGVACLLIGVGLGYLMHRPAAAKALPPATSIVTRTVPVPQIKVVVPPSCLQTAERGDEMIDLFTKKARDRRLSLALKAYTLASQTCRKEASP